MLQLAFELRVDPILWSLFVVLLLAEHFADKAAICHYFQGSEVVRGPWLDTEQVESQDLKYAKAAQQEAHNVETFHMRK